MVKERYVVSPLLSLLHDEVAATTLRAAPKKEESEVIQTVMKLLLILSNVGAAVYQMLRGNILFYILLSFDKASPASLQLVASQLLWKIVSKRCVSSGSPFGQNLEVGQLLERLVALLPQASYPISQYLLGVAMVLSYSAKRKLFLVPLFKEEFRSKKELMSRSAEPPKWSLVDFYRHMIMPNRFDCWRGVTARDHDSLLRVLDLDTLFVLAQFSDNYVRYCALAELRYRLIQVIIPPKEGLPPEYPHMGAVLRCAGVSENEQVEAFLSSMGLYMYGAAAHKILFGRVFLRSTDSQLLVKDEQTGSEVTLLFSAKEAVEEWRGKINEGKMQYGMGFQNLPVKPERRDLILDRDKQLQDLVGTEGAGDG